MIRIELIEEMKAKVSANCGMALTLDETKEVLAALTSPEVVQAAAPGAASIAGGIADLVAGAGAVQVVTDKPTAEQKGPLPEDFPGRAALAGAGINTFAQLRKARDSKEGLTGVTGVGAATAAAIEEALN